nr:MAG TPA: hypothetical protein [Caudoviricetes sp.]DAW89587.1 MAG TPA: hypothetical protein [Bacteriophage sp.]
MISFKSMYLLWTMRCTFDHPYLLSTAQSSPSCSDCDLLAF